MCPSSRSIAVPVEVRLSGSVSPVMAAKIVALAKEHVASSGPARARRESRLLEFVVEMMHGQNLRIEFPRDNPEVQGALEL
jgi:hypothetical protein